jgi:hypothetical protein
VRGRGDEEQQHHPVDDVPSTFAERPTLRREEPARRSMRVSARCMPRTVSTRSSRASSQPGGEQQERAEQVGHVRGEPLEERAAAEVTELSKAFTRA